METATYSGWLLPAVMVVCTGVVLLFLRSLVRRLDRYEEQNKAEHANLGEKVDRVLEISVETCGYLRASRPANRMGGRARPPRALS